MRSYRISKNNIFLTVRIEGAFFQHFFVSAGRKKKKLNATGVNYTWAATAKKGRGMHTPPQTGFCFVPC
jgi:hypothetical protein